MRERFRNLFKSRYVETLEAEVIRLREEVRLWQELCLKKEGLPSLTSQPPVFPKLKQRTVPSSYLRGAERMTSNPPKGESDANKSA